MTIGFKQKRSITWRLIQLFIILLLLFTLLVGVLYNGRLRRQSIAHYSQSMQRDAHAIAQNLSEWIAPSAYEGLDDTRFIVSDDTLTPYLGFIEQLTNSTVYIVDTHHNVTGYFSGVVQTISNPLLPSYLEQCIALGFMGKTPFIQAEIDGETHLTTSMPVMNVHSRVLGVVLLTSTLREQGYAQVPSMTILLNSLMFSFPLAVLLSYFFSRSATATPSQDAVGGTAARALLRQLIDQEDRSHPLSDQMLCEEMARQGCAISRRTVAKYREEMNIPGASGRKQR